MPHARRGYIMSSLAALPQSWLCVTVMVNYDNNRVPDLKAMITILQELALKSTGSVLKLVYSGHRIALELWLPRAGVVKQKESQPFRRCVVAEIKPGDSGLVLCNTVNGIAMPYYDVVRESLPEFNPTAIACLTMIE